MRVRIRAEIQLRGGEWYSITGDVRTREDIEITRGRADHGAQVDPSSMVFQLNNRDGRYSPGNPRSPLYRRIGKNTPIRLGIETASRTYWRFAGEIAAWPLQWDLSGNDVYVPVEATGILRRLGQGGDRVPDVMRRHVVAHSPVAYWPLTDGETAHQGSPVVGNQPLRTYALQEGWAGQAISHTAGWADGELHPWLDPVVSLPEEDRGRLGGTIRPASSSTSWAVEIAQRGFGTHDEIELALEGSGTADDPFRYWYVAWDVPNGNMYISILSETEDSSSIAIVDPDIDVPGLFDGEPHLYRFELSSDGSGSAYRLYRDGVSIASGTYGAPSRPLRRITYGWQVFDDGISEHADLGHLSVWDMDSSSYPSPAANYAAFRGHAGERAAERVIRLCEENGVPLEMVGDPADSLRMGPQYPDALLDLLYSCQEVDGGVLFESRESPSLAFRTLRSKYNRGVALRDED